MFHILLGDFIVILCYPKILFFFLMENEMYPTENSSNSGGVLAHEQKPCKMKQNQQNQIRQRYFNPAIIYDTI